jgi:3-hydroxyisobutyrate dehydrogenase-like beta-hydroxyacid dehydrogenase
LNSAASKTVGVLYPGEMGTALAGVLVKRRLRVVTTLRDRGPATARRAAECGAVVLDSIADVVREADIVLSVVSPAAAEEIVDAYCRLSSIAPVAALFVDVNSIGPAPAERLAARVEGCGVGFVDAAINGLAKNLTSSATLFLSGARCAEVSALFEGCVTTRVIGSEPGRASAMKMLLGGVSKGVCALLLELALVAQNRGMLSDMLAETSRIYPGIAALIDRMLPTYSQHAGRRAQETNELLATAESSGVEPCLLEAVSRLHEMMAGALDGDNAEDGGVTPFVRKAAQLGLLQPEEARAVEGEGEAPAEPKFSQENRLGGCLALPGGSLALPSNPACATDKE